MNLLKRLICISILSLAACNSASETPEVNEKKPEPKIIEAKDLTFEKVISKESLFSDGSDFHDDFYGLKGDSIAFNFSADYRIKTLIIREERSGRIFKTFKNKDKINFIYKVPISNPFSIHITFYKDTYFDIDLTRKSGSVKNYLSKVTIVKDSIVHQKKTTRSRSGKTINMIKLFNEPRKFIVSKTFSLSGKSKIYAPIEIPKNTKEFFYTLRVSGTDGQVKDDGKLFNNVSEEYSKVKMLGLPLWESSGKGTSITREILNNLFPPKKDSEYSLNVFFFDNEKEIKKFISYGGKNYGSAFKYDIKNSALSSQSRVGLIKKPHTGYSYIGLESTSSFSNTYAWLDVIAMTEQVYYYEIKYHLDIKPGS